LTVELTPHSHPATGGDKATWAWQQQQKNITLNGGNFHSTIVRNTKK